MVQWLRLGAPRARGPGSTLGQGTRPDMLKPRVPMPRLKDPACRSEDQRSRVQQLRPGTAK